MNLSISPSLPINPTVEAAIAIFCGEIIFPPVAPPVPAAIYNAFNASFDPAIFTWTPPNNKLDAKSLPVTNVPIVPRNGEITGKNLPVAANPFAILSIIPLCFITTDNATIPIITTTEGNLLKIVSFKVSAITFGFTPWMNPAITVATNNGAAGAKIHLNITLGSPLSLNHVASCPKAKLKCVVVGSNALWTASTTGLVPIIKIIIKIYGTQAINASFPVIAWPLLDFALLSSLIKILVATIIKIIANKLDKIVGNSAPIAFAINGCVK